MAGCKTSESEGGGLGGGGILHPNQKKEKKESKKREKNTLKRGVETENMLKDKKSKEKGNKKNRDKNFNSLFLSRCFCRDSATKKVKKKLT